LRKTSPSNVLLCEEIPTKFVVTNPGSGTVKDVKIEDKLPDGLKTIDGDSTIAIDAGTLAEGESKEFTVTLKADKTGKYENTATASSSRGLKAEASSVTQVRQPILEIDKTGPEKRYLGRSVTYEITVANKGDAPANDLVIRDRLPAGVKFLSASGNGTAENRRVQWSLGTVEPGDSRKVSVTVMPESAKTISNTAIVSAECAEGVRASARTQIEGIPAILLEVIDTQDPIEVGGRTTYVITATNQGTAPATNIQIICGLEEEMSHISSSGVTRSSAEGSKVTFQPLGSLAPGEKAEWRVNVRAVSAGDVRFKVDMNTDQLSRPVEETEATHLYE
jgi:uncharacterized repeat protein (TIGR01451 family)